MRRKSAPKRKILPDPKYRSEVVAKFVNCMMLNGKKSVAEKIIYSAFTVVCERLKLKDNIYTGQAGEGEDGGSSEGGTILEFFDKVLEQVSPSVEVRSRRVGGATYQIPMEVRANRRSALGMRGLITAARARREKGMVHRLAGEMIEAYEGRGNAVKKREDMHRMAKANQAFAHYRW